MNPLFTVYLRSHHFLVRTTEVRAKVLCREFCRRFIHEKLAPSQGTLIKVKGDTFAAADLPRVHWRFHINVWQEFLDYLKGQGINESIYQIFKEPDTTPITEEFRVRQEYTPREYQVPYIAYLSKKDNTPSRLIGLQPGDGKGIISMFAMQAHQSRTLISVLPMYMGKWKDELIEKMHLTEQDICLISGEGKLLKLLAAREQELQGGPKIPKVIIISNRTWGLWLDLYMREGEAIRQKGYPCTPDNFLGYLGVGLKIVDEVHQHFHSHFLTDLHTHGPICINLSATLISKDKFLMRMYEVMFPVDWRIANREISKYVNLLALHYRMARPDQVRYNERGSSMYSHNAFEEYLMKNKKALGNYVRMIKEWVDKTYVNHPRPKKRCIVFVRRVDFAELCSAKFKELYPDLNIGVFAADYPIENLMGSDACFTTLGSAGTARDIPDLVAVIMTQAVGSWQSNIQAVGRLRRLADNPDVNFVYFVCDDIPAHLAYHKEKRLLFADRAKAHWDEYHSEPI